MPAQRLPRWVRYSALAGILLGCATDGGPTGPVNAAGAGYRIVALGGDTLHGVAGATVPGASVMVLGPGDLPVVGARVRWRVVQGGGRLAQSATFTDSGGVATAAWVLGTDLSAPQILRSDLELSDDRGPSGRARVPVLLRASAALPSGVQPTAVDTTPLLIDTIGALLGPAVQLRLPDGRPIVGATIDFTVRRGGGRLGNTSAVTDSGGHAALTWQLGDSAGPQEVLAAARGTPGANSRQALIRALTLPGTPIEIRPAGDTIRFDAIGDTVRRVQLRDRAGNILYPRALWTPLTPAIIGGGGDDGIISLGVGTGLVRVRYGSLVRTVPVVVSQTASTVVVDSATITLNWVGAQARVGARVRDRRGAIIPGAVVTWSADTLGAATVDAQGMVRAVRGGVTVVMAAYQGIATPVKVRVVQRAVAISVSPALDTLSLDSVRAPTIVALDSNGAVIPSPVLRVTMSDSGVVAVDPRGAVRGTLPGTTRITYYAGTASASIDRVVEGSAILVAGQRMTAPAILNGLPPIMITNGRVRISWSTAMWERGSFAMEVRLGNTWQPASHQKYGDWLYITSSIITWPNEIAIIEDTPDRVGLRMRYDDHWFLPQMEGYPASILPQPYPFTRTVWLAKQDNGYYSWVDVVNDLHMNIVEHETGFGGLWGPATIRTNSLEIRTDTLSKTVTYNGNPGQPVTHAAVDAAEFIRDNDPVRRLLVPLPEAPFITPVFPGWGYGSVYRYASASRSFGVYMYATAVGGGPSASQICGAAWANAPFPLRALTPAEVASCGPASP